MMTDLSLEEAINLGGGPVSVENCPAVISPDQLNEIISTMYSVSNHFDRIIAKTRRQCFGAIALTMSPTFGCRIRTIKEGFVILLPLGFPARIRVLARLLLRYWGHEKGIRIIRSILDDVPGDADAIPPILKPLFLEDFDQEVFWQRLELLDSTINKNSENNKMELFETDVRELIHLSLVYTLSHEFTHAIHGHFDLLERSRSENLNLSSAEIRRGIETDADNGATRMSMHILYEDFIQALDAGQSVRLEIGWLRLAYAVTMLFAITDAHKKYLGGYDVGAYDHPMVRCELFFSFAERTIQADESVHKTWQENFDEGWIRCVLAFGDLNLDALTGMFGKLPPEIYPAPLHTLCYSATPGGITDRVVSDRCRDSLRLMNHVRKLLPSIADIYQ